MNKTIARTLAGLTLAGAATMLAAAPADAATAVNWTQRTCSAFAAWEKHPNSAAFQAVVIDSTYLSKSYLKADVGQWDADASSPSPKAAKYAEDDPQYVYEDCHGGSGL